MQFQISLSSCVFTLQCVQVKMCIIIAFLQILHACVNFTYPTIDSAESQTLYFVLNAQPSQTQRIPQNLYKIVLFNQSLYTQGLLFLIASSGSYRSSSRHRGRRVQKSPTDSLNSSSSVSRFMLEEHLSLPELAADSNSKQLRDSVLLIVKVVSNCRLR
ncbi:Hypothetical_protein [Hexamita inflata]|uniref:Hypothetical_protein n=1 Tax=Hexamita inflata TaxID=28002 RepID=A0AA86TRQ8_9EUKA|nr:Hypothetical protein HINF_LOCUS13711 [Hexamita inflata]